MTRTLIISDLHLGGRFFHGVLTRPEPLDRLCRELVDVDRLVLLGDVVELMERRPRQAMATAEPVLRAIGRALPADREIVIVPGNHDRPFVSPWIRATGSALTATSEVPLEVTPALSAVADWLGRQRVRARYPGVWLQDGVFATHGHYLDRHLRPVSSYGVARGRLGRKPDDAATPWDYERPRSPQRASASGVLPRRGAWLVEEAAELWRAMTMPVIKHRVLRPRYARFTSLALRTQFNRAGVPALARVVHRLGIDADWVIFGHLHRLGPMTGDDPSLWQSPLGRPRILNTGSWLYEPLLVHRAAPPNPYWPGGAIVLEPGQDPRAVGLLDELEAAALLTRGL